MVDTLPRDPAELDGRERDAVEALALRLADDEFVLGERYVEWQIFAPTLESDLALANVAQDELGHARIRYDLLQDPAFGWTEQELLYERAPDGFRHATLVELPFERGDWADAIVRGYLYDVAEHLRLEALEGSTFAPIAEPVGKMLAEERYHREHAGSWLERLCADDDARGRVQNALDRLFPHALTLFEPGEHEDAIVELGLRTATLDDLREQWLATVGPFLESLDLVVPMDPGDDPGKHLPDARGRDGTHTDHWPALYEEYTRTYHELGRSDVRRLRGEGA